MSKPKLKILFIVAEDWYFHSHRLALAIYAIKKGHDVTLLSNYNDHREKIENENIRTIDWRSSRNYIGFMEELRSINTLNKVINSCEPNIIHAVAIKPVLMTSLLTKFNRSCSSVFAISGLGYVFTSRKISAVILKVIFKILFKTFLNGPQNRIIVQNRNDYKTLNSGQLIKKGNLRLVKGAGVDVGKFSYKKISSQTQLVMLPSRMIWTKGIKEFVKCAKKIKSNHRDVKFVLVGMPDHQNPDSVPKKYLRDLNSKGIVEWWGYQQEMNEVLYKSRIICFPSTYGEGVPKSLIEAASCGRPIVTYDVPGCNEIVKHDFNGMLIKPGDIDGLVHSLDSLIKDIELCNTFGMNGRLIVEKYFSQEKINDETMEIWKELI